MSLRTVGRELLPDLPALIGLYVVDALLLAQGVFTVIVVCVVLFGSVVGALRGRKVTLRLLACLVAEAAVFATLAGNNALGHRRAERIIIALDRYKAAHGRYPEQIDDLVPRFLPSVPLAKYALMFNAFHYSTDGDHAYLSYITLPPFGRTVFRLKEREWGSLD